MRQYVAHRGRHRIGIDIVQVGGIGVGLVLLHPRLPFLEVGVVHPLRIGGVLQVLRTDNPGAVVVARGLQHRGDRGRDIGEVAHRLPVEVGDLADRLRGGLGRGLDEHHVGARTLDLDDLAVDRGIGDFVAHRGDDLLLILLAETRHEAADIVLARIVVLPKDPDPGILVGGQCMLGVDRAFGRVVGLPAHGPRKFRRLAPLGCAGRDEELRHLLLVEVLLHHGVGRRAEQLVDRVDLIVLDQLAHHLDGLGRLEAVVVGDEGDLAAVHAAGIVHHVPVGGDRLADGTVGRQRSRVGVGVAEFDLLVGDAGIVLLLGIADGRRRQRERGTAGRESAAIDLDHLVSSVRLF